MKKYIYLIGGILMLLLSPLYGAEFKENDSISNFFKQKNINGTFVLYDVQTKSLTGYNETRAFTQYQPASTFKILNTLIGLSLGIVKNVDIIAYKHDGKKLWNKSWEKDVNLREAIKLSHLPAYQQLAQKIGTVKMQENLSKIDYGNKNIGKNLTTFWLRGPLKISAIEQVYFLEKLAKRELDYSKDIQESVIEIIKLDNGDMWTLYGKTGWATRDLNKNLNPTLGWFIGWVEQNKKLYIFALNMDIKDSSQLPLRQEIALEILKNELNI